MRTRNISPRFFLDEDLADLPMDYRMLFVGLWCVADCLGRLEDRPKRIKRELFPTDTFDVDAGLTALASIGKVKRYEVDGVRYLWIPKLTRNQRFSKEERDKGSKLPPHPEDTNTTHAPGWRQGGPLQVPSKSPPLATGAFAPDDGRLTTDNGRRTTDVEGSPARALVDEWNRVVPSHMRHDGDPPPFSLRDDWPAVFAAVAGSPFYTGQDGKRQRGAVDLGYVAKHADEVLERGKRKPPVSKADLPKAYRRIL